MLCKSRLVYESSLPRANLSPSLRVNGADETYFDEKLCGSRFHALWDQVGRREGEVKDDEWRVSCSLAVPMFSF